MPELAAPVDGYWRDGRFHVPGAPACPSCSCVVDLEPESLDPSGRRLTGSGLLQCAMCGAIRAHQRDLHTLEVKP